MRSLRLLVTICAAGFALLAACVGDDPATSTDSTSSGGASSGGASSSGASSSGASSSGASSSGTPACAGDTVDACGASCTKCTAPTGGTVECVSGACQQKCGADATLCGAACVDVKGSDTDCGKCGRSCNGSKCQSGVCEPVEMGSGFTSVESIAASPTSMGVLMVVNGKDLKRCGVATGCTAATLTDIATSVYNMKLVTTAGNDIFFEAAPSDPYIVYQCPVTGCPGGGPNELDIENNVGVGALIAGPTHLYYTRSSYCSTYSRRCALPGCTGLTDVRPKAGSCAFSYLDNANNPSHELVVPSKVVSVGAKTVLWATGSLYNDATKLLRGCALTASCTTPTEIPGDGPSALAYYSGRHYGAAGAQIFGVDDTAGATTRTSLVTDAPGIVGMAVDASGIYWVNATTGNVRRCAKLAGCTTAEVETLATGQTGATGIALDTSNVYWSLPTKVLRVVK